jgi:hypothetical protein
MSITESAIGLLHRRPGRKRLPQRRPGAERDHRPVEPEHAIKATVMSYRTRFIGPQNAADPLCSHALGRLLLNARNRLEEPISIDQRQYDAGHRYSKLIARHAGIMGYSTGSPRSPGFELVANGPSCGQEPDEQVILEIRREFSGTYRALVDEGIQVARTTYDVCLDRMPFEAIDIDRIGVLRIGLNALVHYWK